MKTTKTQKSVAKTILRRAEEVNHEDHNLPLGARPVVYIYAGTKLEEKACLAFVKRGLMVRNLDYYTREEFIVVPGSLKFFKEMIEPKEEEKVKTNECGDIVL